MKTIILLMTIVYSFAFAEIPQGTYQLDAIKCSKGKDLEMGGKFISYKISLDVTASDMTMTAKAKSNKWAPFKLTCTQINKGSMVYTAEGEYEGDLPNTYVACSNRAWIGILKKHLFGVEEYGTFTYEVSGKKLTIKNPNTVTRYSCEDAGGYPIYHYTKI